MAWTRYRAKQIVVVYSPGLGFSPELGFFRFVVAKMFIIFMHLPFLHYTWLSKWLRDLSAAIRRKLTDSVLILLGMIDPAMRV